MVTVMRRKQWAVINYLKVCKFWPMTCASHSLSEIGLQTNAEVIIERSEKVVYRLSNCMISDDFNNL